jgi:hypothetical protein
MLTTACVSASPIGVLLIDDLCFGWSAGCAAEAAASLPDRIGRNFAKCCQICCQEVPFGMPAFHELR